MYTESLSHVGRWKSSLAFIYILMQLVLFYPYEIKPVYLPFLNISGTVLMCVFSVLNYLISMTTKPVATNVMKPVILLSVVQWVGFSLCFVNSGQYSAVGGKILLIVYYCSLLVIVISTLGMSKFFKIYNRWILLMAILGVIAWFLSEFRGFSPFYSVLDSAEEGRLIYNYILTFSVHDSNTFSMRYAGFFDEPGAMAQWGLFALLINKVYVKEKWIEIPLIVCLIFTFSMGFYIQLFVYYLLFYANRKNAVYAGFFAAIVILLFYGLSLTQGGDNAVLYERTFGRFTDIIEQGQKSGNFIAVDDREDLANLALQEFLENPLLGTTKTDVYLGDNMFEPLALYGIIGTFFIYFPFLWLFVKSINAKNTDFRNVAIIVLVGVLHRPYHTNVLWNFILFSIIIMSYYSDSLRNKQIT